MQEISENDFNTFIISNPFGLVVFVAYGSHYTLDQKNQLVGIGDNVALISIETISEKMRTEYGIDHTPYWFAFKEQNFVFRQPGILSRDSIRGLLTLLQGFNMIIVRHETGEVVYQ